MKSIDIVYGNYLKNKIGPSVNLIRLINNKESFTKEGIFFNIYSLDLINEEPIHNKLFLSFLKKIYKRIVVILKLNKFLFFIRKNIYYSSIRYSQQIVNFYLQINSDSSIIIFDEFFTCLEYLKNTSTPDKKILLFHHGNGDFFKMLEIYYPGLKKSKFLQSLNNELHFVLTKIDKLIFVSEFGKKNFFKTYPYLTFHSSKFEHLYYGVEDSVIKNNIILNKKEKSTVFRLVCVGSVNPRKAQKLIIDALIETPQNIRDQISIDFLGSGGEYMEELKKIIQENHLSDKVKFHGPVENVSDFLLKSNLFILTSLDEGLPIAIIEALKFGLPIIATAIAGIPETINKNNGILISPNKEDIKDTFLKLPSLDLNKMGKESRKLFLEKFSYDNYIKNYSKILNNL